VIDSMIDLAARGGYQSVSIAQIATHAGVSSATFYELFDDKEDCAVSAYAAATERMLGPTTTPPASVGTREDWSRYATAALRALLDAVAADSAAAVLLFVEALAGGSRMREERTPVMDVFEERVRTVLAGMPADSARLDVPATAVIGGIRTIVSRHLRTSSEDQLPVLAGDLIEWVESYAVAGGRTPWSTGPGARLRSSGPGTRRTAARPKRLPRGRHRLPPSVVARSHRTRIIYATAEVALARGYAQATVKDIVSAAGVSRQIFYEHFTDKQHAFLEAQQYPTQHILDRCAAAYFSAETWPERVWCGLKALLALVEVSPALAYLRLVECYAAGPAAIRRAEEITRSFTIFFEEGYGVRPEAGTLPRLTSQAISGAVFEMIQRHASRHEVGVVPSLLPQLTYIVIAPFVGAEAAIEILRELIVRERHKAERERIDRARAEDATDADAPTTPAWRPARR
jgi:AcrR family transcriptional regulator